MKDGGIMKNIIKSNKLNELADLLIEIILKRNDPFTTIKIVTSSISVQQYFKAYWLAKHNEILMNVEFININDALLSLISSDKSYKNISKETLKTLTIKHLSSETIKDILSDDIKEYLYESNSINPIKLYDLADALSGLFVEYDNDAFKVNGWQKVIYDAVINDAINVNNAPLRYVYENKVKVNKVDNMYFFGFVSFNKLQEVIIDDVTSINNITFLMLEESEDINDYSIISAPSLLREIETVHSKICELVNTSNANYSDFLVLAPNISIYEGVIPRVFNQDNISFPSIPYSINDRKKVMTNVTSGLNKLFEIHSKGFYTRYDFFELINNQDIKAARNLTNEDIDAFTQAILAMNVYRNKESNDDWKYAKHRVLLSKVSSINNIDENIVELTDGNYLPYSTISLNDEAIIKFVSLIDDIDSWCNLLNDITYVNKDNILLIKEELSKWFSIKDTHEFETNNYFKKVCNVINTFYRLDVSNNNVPLSTLVYFMLDVSKVTAIKSGDYFIKGVTFADFNEISILSSKYIFFLNAGSKELPKVIIKKEIDLRDYDISNKEKSKQAFFIQVNNASNHFFVSYINKDLKTDEELYPSTFVLDLKNKKKVTEEKISLDETRSWNKLFTKKEYKNKDYYLGLLSSKEDSSFNSSIEINHTYLRKVKLKDMSSFLEEPLMYKFKSLFGRNDETDEKIRKEYEPFELDNLSSSVLIRKLAHTVLENKENLSEDAQKEILNRFNLEHKLPDINQEVNESSFDLLVDEVKSLKELVDAISSNYEIFTIPDISFNTLGNEWTLTCNQPFCKIVDNFKRTYIQLKKRKDKIKSDDSKSYYQFLDLYIASLMDVSTLNEEVEYKVELVKGFDAKQTFKITPTLAKQLLEKIYIAMNDYSSNVFASVSLLKEDSVESLDELISIATNQNGPWQYFDDKNLFDVEKQLGYNDDTFIEDFNDIVSKQKELIAFINKSKEDQ